MDFLKRLFGAKPANEAQAQAPAVPNSGAAAPQLPAATGSTPATNSIVGGGKHRSQRRQTRRNRKHSRKYGRKHK